MVRLQPLTASRSITSPRPACGMAAAGWPAEAARAAAAGLRGRRGPAPSGMCEDAAEHMTRLDVALRSALPCCPAVLLSCSNNNTSIQWLMSTRIDISWRDRRANDEPLTRRRGRRGKRVSRRIATTPRFMVNLMSSWHRPLRSSITRSAGRTGSGSCYRWRALSTLESCRSASSLSSSRAHHARRLFSLRRSSARAQ